MLKHEELVAQTPERDEGADRSPCQYYPKSKAVLDHRHHLQFDAHEIRSNPFTEEEGAVYCDRHKESPGYPSMKPVHINIGGSEKETGNVDFASQQKDKRDLCDRHPCRSEAHALPVICIVDDRPCCQEQGNDNPVCEYDQRRP